MDQFCGSAFWDWDVTWNTDNPDFTPCFERTVLGLLPCAFLWLFTLIDVYCSYTSGAKEVPWTPLNVGKLALATILTNLEIGLLIIYRVILSGVSYPVDLYIPAIRATTLLLSSALLLYSKGKGVRSSGVQFIFWLLFTITQAIRFRTVIQSRYNVNPLATSLEPSVYIIEVVYFPLVFGQFLLHCWADAAPAYQPEYEVPTKNPCPEYSCSFLSRIFFHWFTSLAWTGFRKPLEYSDLWQLNWHDLSRSIVPIFDRNWPSDLNRGLNRKNNGLQKSKLDGSDYQNGKGHSTFSDPVKHSYQAVVKTKKEPGVFATIAKSFGCKYFFGFVLRSMTDMMLFVSPLILNELINFVGSNEPTWKGILYALVLFTTAFVGTIFNANGIHNFYVTGLRTKTALISAVYRKSLLLSNTAKRAESAGEIVNHMAVDVQYVTEFFGYGYQLWGAYM